MKIISPKDSNGEVLVELTPTELNELIQGLASRGRPTTVWDTPPPFSDGQDCRYHEFIKHGEKP